MRKAKRLGVSSLVQEFICLDVLHRTYFLLLRQLDYHIYQQVWSGEKHSSILFHPLLGLRLDADLVLAGL